MDFFQLIFTHYCVEIVFCLEILKNIKLLSMNKYLIFTSNEAYAAKIFPTLVLTQL